MAITRRQWNEFDPVGSRRFYCARCGGDGGGWVPRRALCSRPKARGFDITLSPMIDTVTFSETIVHRFSVANVFPVAGTVIEKSFVICVIYCGNNRILFSTRHFSLVEKKIKINEKRTNDGFARVLLHRCY